VSSVVAGLTWKFAAIGSPSSPATRALSPAEEASTHRSKSAPSTGGATCRVPSASA
jgi:hypothetical protein